MDRTAYSALLAQYATSEVSGEGRVSWDGGVKCVMPSVKLYGKCEQDGTPTPDTPVPVRCNNGTFQVTGLGGIYDGGTVQAPELLAIPGTDIRDEWDAQTGLGIRRCGQYTFSGAEPFVLSGGVTPPDYNVYYAFAAVPNVPAAANNPGLCTHLNRKPSMYGNEMGVIFGVSNQQIYFSVPKETYPDAETWKAYLAAQYAAGTPVKIVYIIAEPEPFYSPPARLTMPRGSGQIVQTGGDVANCPITARYLTHS